MPTPGSNECSASGWPMPRMKTLMELAEPRPWTMLRFGTAPCRPSMLLAWRSRSDSSPKAVTATGTSWIDSTRRRAVTVTRSRVVASASSVVSTAGPVASWANTCTGASSTPATARLKYLRFIAWSPIWSTQVRAGRPGRASYLRPMGHPRQAPDTGCLADSPDSPMSFLIVLAALAFLMYVAYRGHSVILFAPIAALGAVLATDPSLVAPMFTGLFMEKMVGFLKLYFPVFLLGAIFGKV